MYLIKLSWIDIFIPRFTTEYIRMLPLVLERTCGGFSFFLLWITKTGSLGLGRVKCRILFWVRSLLDRKYMREKRRCTTFRFLLSLKFNAASIWFLYLLSRYHNWYVHSNTFLIGDRLLLTTEICNSIEPRN